MTGRIIESNSHPPTAASARDPTREPPLAPEEVLFRRRDAPPRYAEKDVYFAGSGSLPTTTTLLPGSDLLKAVHGYAAGFYEAAAAGRGEKGGKTAAPAGGRLVDERAMDETALLAFGVLLEEAAREALGKDGDLVFTEGVTADGNAEDEPEDGIDRGMGPTERDDRASGKRLTKRRRLSRGSTAG